jgi:thiosulfate reductase cytochrome b subunit
MNKQVMTMKSFLLHGLLLSAISLSAFAKNNMHPEVPILDAMGDRVIESGLPMSTMTTCGGDCHQTGFIMANSDHADAGASRLGDGERLHDWQQGPGFYGGWNPLAYDTDGLDENGDMDVVAWLKRYGSRHVGGGPAAGMVEMNCLLCHTTITDHTARNDALEKGDFAWANTASLASIGVISAVEGEWQWNPSVFNENGALKEGVMDIRAPTDANCSACHGIANNDLETPLTITDELSARHNTDRTGQIISPQKLLNSGLNISGKEALNFPFDVHTDRVVGCTNCHYSLNNPVYFQQRAESRPEHLDFDPRRLDTSEYLARPLHQFAKGRSTLGLAAMTENSLRRCESCHIAENVHEWLPYKQRHITALACEACHIPKLFGPALQAMDWTMLGEDRQPQRQYRNIDGDPASVETLIEGYRPLILARENADGNMQLAPFNLVTSWYRVAGDPARPVSRETLEEALFSGDAYHPDVLAGLDADGDGSLTDAELRLVDESSVKVVRQRLEAVGLTGLEIQSEMTPFSVNHNVVNGENATRDCSNCHDRDSLLAAKFTLSGYAPGNVLPTAETYPGIAFSGAVENDAVNGPDFASNAHKAGFYIIGHHSADWADLLGLVMFLGIIVAVSVHGLARYISARRRPPVAREYERVHMYDAYERIWHWLQASAILMLLFTGLVIHKPHFFGMFSFRYMVNVHNVLGFILLINAALALFFHLASGQYRQYVPKPRNFFRRAMSQALYYSKGIFAGDSHPLEKTKANKLNPLQQITYLGILNILLPAQIITGVLIWGLQRWPHIAAEFGGLPVLAVVHTLLAWTFATFIVMHIYLTTTGHSPLAGIKSMIVGWDDVEKHTGGAQSSSPQGESK